MADFIARLSKAFIQKQKISAWGCFGSFLSPVVFWRLRESRDVRTFLLSLALPSVRQAQDDQKGCTGLGGGALLVQALQREKSRPVDLDRAPDCENGAK